MVTCRSGMPGQGVYHHLAPTSLTARSEHNMQRSAAPVDERRKQLVERGARQSGGQRALHPEPCRLPVAARPQPPPEPNCRSKPRPRARNRRVWAGVEKTAQAVTSNVFDEACRRDPEHRRRWVVLVDGDRHQIARVRAAKSRGLGQDIALVVDFIHVLEYLRDAAWCFFDQGDRNAEKWVTERASPSCRNTRAMLPLALAVALPCGNCQQQARGRRRLRRLPRCQTEHAPLRPLPCRGLAHRHGGHRRGLPPSHRGPPRHHRGSLEPRPSQDSAPYARAGTLTTTGASTSRPSTGETMPHATPAQPLSES